MFDDQGQTQSAAFRRHRHDVLNELQILRAYLQMGQHERAIGIVDRTAEWLQSLTRWQVDGGQAGEQLLWCAASCPNICLSSLSVVNVLTEHVVRTLSEWLTTANDELSQQGIRIQISVRVDNLDCVIRLLSKEAYEMSVNWQEQFTDLRFVSASGEKIKD